MKEVNNNNNIQTKIVVHNSVYFMQEVYDWLCLLIKGLVKTLLFVNLSKFGHQFLCTQKQLPISKTPCITP